MVLMYNGCKYTNILYSCNTIMNDLDRNLFKKEKY